MIKFNNLREVLSKLDSIRKKSPIFHKPYAVRYRSLVTGI
jgi:hypothetical protein